MQGTAAFVPLRTSQFNTLEKVLGESLRRDTAWFLWEAIWISRAHEFFPQPRAPDTAHQLNELLGNESSYESSNKQRLSPVASQILSLENNAWNVPHPSAHIAAPPDSLQALKPGQSCTGKQGFDPSTHLDEIRFIPSNYWSHSQLSGSK